MRALPNGAVKKTEEIDPGRAPARLLLAIDGALERAVVSMKRGTLLACLAGLAASVSSLVLKLPEASSGWHWSSPFAAFVALNLVSMSLFSASLRDNPSLVAAAISISTNLVASAVLGTSLLGEAASWRFALGLALTVLGSVLLLLGSTKRKEE